MEKDDHHKTIFYIIIGGILILVVVGIVIGIIIWYKYYYKKQKLSNRLYTIRQLKNGTANANKIVFKVNGDNSSYLTTTPHTIDAEKGTSGFCNGITSPNGKIFVVVEENGSFSLLKKNFLSYYKILWNSHDFNNVKDDTREFTTPFELRISKPDYFGSNSLDSQLLLSGNITGTQTVIFNKIVSPAPDTSTIRDSCTLEVFNDEKFEFYYTDADAKKKVVFTNIV